MRAQRRARRARRLGTIGTVAAAASAMILFNPLAANADTSTLTPTAIMTSSGSIGSGQTVSNLAVQDLAGTTDNLR